MSNVKSLRQEGRLEEALTLALAENEAHPDDPRTWNDVVWCYDALCKRAAVQGDLMSFGKAFEELVSMNEFEKNQMLSDTMCWRLRALLANSASKVKSEEIPALADKVFEMAKHIHPTIPSEPYTVLCKAFYKLREHWSSFPVFMEWWGWDSFRPEDYACEIGLDGHNSPVSIVEGCHIGAAKILIKQHDKEAIMVFLPRMEQLNHDYPEMTYLGYYIGKLMFATGQAGQEALEALCPFVRKKRSEFWAWQLLSEAFPDDREKKLACLLRAADCRTKEEFLLNVRLQLTYLFLNGHDYANASYQLHKYVAEKARQKKMLSRDVWHLTQESWFAQNNPKERPAVNLDFMAITNEIVFGDVPYHIGVVSHVSADKKMVTMIYGKEKSGFFKYDRFLKTIHPGDFLKLKWEDISSDGFVRPMICSQITEAEAMTLQTSEGPLDNFFRRVSGKVSSNRAGTAWFVKFNEASAFIPHDLLRRHPLQVGDSISARILWDRNHTRGDWGWKCVEIVYKSLEKA